MAEKVRRAQSCRKDLMTRLSDIDWASPLVKPFSRFWGYRDERKAQLKNSVIHYLSLWCFTPTVDIYKWLRKGRSSLWPKLEGKGVTGRLPGRGPC